MTIPVVRADRGKLNIGGPILLLLLGAVTIFVLPQIFEVGWLQMLGIILMVGGLGWGAAEFLGRRTPRQASDENMAAAQQSRPIITE